MFVWRFARVVQDCMWFPDQAFKRLVRGVGNGADHPPPLRCPRLVTYVTLCLAAARAACQRRAAAASAHQAQLESRRQHGSAHDAVIPSSAGLADAKGLSYTFTSGQGRAVPSWRAGAPR
jgi:hypothetical protein